MKRPEHEPVLERMLAALPDDLAGFERLCAAVTEWEPLLAAAAYHGVEGLLEYYLLRLPQLPAGLDAAHLERQLALRHLRQARLDRPLGEALEGLDRAGIRTVVLKGPVLAERLYPDTGLRSSSDLDLMVAEADLDRATAALEALGYHAGQGLLRRYLRENRHHLVLHREQTPPLELHFRAATSFGVAVPSEELLSRALPCRTAAGSAAWVLSPEDELLFLAVHAAQHLLVTYVLFYDMKLLLRRCPEVDWSAVDARAQSFRVTAAVSMAFGFLEQHLAVGIPKGYRISPRDGLRFRLAASIRSALYGHPPLSTACVLGARAFRALLCDRPAATAWRWRHRLLRAVRRRAQRYLPWAVPAAWSR